MFIKPVIGVSMKGAISAKAFTLKDCGPVITEIQGDQLVGPREASREGAFPLPPPPTAPGSVSEDFDQWEFFRVRSFFG